MVKQGENGDTPRLPDNPYVDQVGAASVDDFRSCRRDGVWIFET
ncbi:MAG TPA: hypothetical protein VIP98_12100 [Microlunatus sp.]